MCGIKKIEQKERERPTLNNLHIDVILQIAKHMKTSGDIIKLCIALEDAYVWEDVRLLWKYAMKRSDEELAEKLRRKRNKKPKVEPAFDLEQCIFISPTYYCSIL